MLPTTGYFRGLACPDHQQGRCHRPYCHFRHDPRTEPVPSGSSNSTPSGTVLNAEAQQSTDFGGRRTSEKSFKKEAKKASLLSTDSGSSVQNIADYSPDPQEKAEVEPEQANSAVQSDIFQQLVSEAVKKVLAENPLLAAAGVDPTTVLKSINTSALAAQAAVEVSPPNLANKKKYYPRPPDTPSYNPTPIKELQKRKSSEGKCPSDLGSSFDANEYSPTSRSAKVNEAPGKGSIESETTDFSSDGDDVDENQRKCDFDMLEEVLAEHLQNNKIKVKKKRVKALGKLQYSLANSREKIVDESSMISDARNMSDQESSLCETPKAKTVVDSQEITENSYFLPPSPIFTSSSDGFGNFNSIVYSKPSTSPEQCEAKLSTVPDEENVVSEKTDKKNDRIERVCGKKDKIRDEKGNSHHEKKEMEKPVKKDLEKSAKKETERASKKEKERAVESSCKLATIVAAVKENPVSGNETKKKAKGHSMLPQVVHSLGAPKMARPSVRSWAPRSTNADAAKDTSDQLEELLQQMDGDDSSNNSEMKDNSKNLTLSPLPKKSKNKTYKVDLDKEIESLTNSSKSKREVEGKSISSTESTKKTKDISEGKLGNDDKEKTESTKLKEKKDEKKGNESDDSEESDKVDAASKKEESASGSESDKEKSDDKTEESEDNSDSDREKGKYKRKRKRSRSSSSDSSRSHYQKRKKKKKSQKRRKKHGKKRKKYRDQDSESDSDAEGSSKDEANENKSEADDDDDDDQKAESKGQKKHSKRRRKKSKHNKKKYKRKKWKSKSRRRRSRSSTRSRSVSASRHRSNSSKELSPTSSRHRSRSSSLSESQSPKRSRSQNMKRRRSQSTSRSRSQSPRRSRSPRRKKRSRRSKNGSQSPRKDKGDVSSRSHSESGSNRSRSRSQSHSSSKKESPRSESPTQSPSPKGKVGEKLEGESSNMKKKVQDENESKNQSCKSTPSHTDSSKSPSTSPRRKKKRRSRSRSRSHSKSNKSRSRSPQSKKRHNRNRSESPVTRSRSPMTKKKRSRSRSQSSSKRNSKGNSHKQRSRSRSKSRSRSSGKKKKDHRSRSPTPGKKHSRDHINEKNQRSERESKNQSNKSTSSRTSSESEKMKPIPFPVDPSKIKLEKDSLIAHIPVVPDLSIVKTEKEDKEQLSSSAIKDKQSSQTLSSNYLKDKSTHTQSEKASRNNAAEISNNESATVNDKDKEKHKSIREKERRSHHDKSGVDNALNARSVTEGRSSTDSKRSSERKSVSERKGSTETKDRSLAQESESAKPLSMFDMVAASINPPKPKILKEFSIFDNVAADGYESSSDSPSPSEYDENIDKQNTETASNITQGALSKSSDDLALKKDKTAVTTPKSERRNSSSSRTEKSNESHKRHHSHSSSGSHKDNKHDAKDDLSSGKKRKSSSHISSTSGSHHSSSSSHHKSNSSSSSSSSQKNSSSSSSHHKSSSTNKHQDHDTVSSSTNGKSNNSSSKSKEQRPSKSSSSQSSKLKEHKHSQSSSSSNNLNKKREPGSGSHLKDSKHRSRSRSQSQNEEEKKKKMKASSAEDSSDSISDREAFSPSKDDEGGDESPLPDLSVLDEIPQDDWEQMIDSSSGKFDLKHLENLRNEEEWDLEDLDKDDPEVMEECMKMFNEYQPPEEEQEPQPSTKKMKSSKEEEPEYLPGKQRFARSNAIGNLASKKTNAGPNNRKLTPTQVMMERYKKLKEKQAALMKQLKRQKQMLEERGASSSSSSAVSSTTSTKSAAASSSSSTALQSPPHSASGLKRRISHVPNVSSLLHAREKIKNLPPTSTRSLLSPNTAKPGGVLPPTVAHTVTKGAKRVAHTPKPEVFVRPIVQAEFGSKVPQNIRQRYLNSFIDECLKFSGEKEAFNLAVAEERVCYKRASSRMVYLNLAVNALKRLRTQQTAGEAAQELLDTDPEFADGATSDEPSSSTKPSTSGGSGGSASPSVSKIDSGHPLNPNHVRLSHFTVLSLGGQKGSWSIEKPKKTSMEHVNANIKGPAFYKHLKKYILDEEKLGDNGFPIPDPEEKGKACIKVIDTRKKLSPSAVERFCDRCSVLYKVDKWGFPKSLGPCVHHWGRPYKRRGYGGLETRYSCCGGDLQSEGCSQATTHVSENYDPNNLRGYVRTLPKDTKDSECGVYALDCEMCYTTAGNELTRVTVIDTEGRSVYEQLVKPENPIIDYNTRFSGITESDLEDVKTTIRDVQAAMLTRFSDKTILIGHSLESDFHALKLIHDTVVDTSIVFPHKMGLPYKRALKNLASEYLKKIIQNDVSGHDSAEDAITCMHLMQWRIKEDLKGIK